MIATARTIHINPVLLPQGVNTIDANWRALADDNVVQRPFGDTPYALIVEVALRIAVGWKGIDDDRILRPASKYYPPGNPAVNLQYGLRRDLLTGQTSCRKRSALSHA